MRQASRTNSDAFHAAAEVYHRIVCLPERQSLFARVVAAALVALSKQNLCGTLPMDNLEEIPAFIAELFIAELFEMKVAAAYVCRHFARSPKSST